MANNGPRVFVRHLDLGYEQPAWPVVISRVSNISRYSVAHSPQVLFVCDSAAAVAVTNIRQIKDEEWLTYQIDRALRHSVSDLDNRWEIKHTEPTILEYVDAVTKPQFLNFMQTALYKITPYALLKETQAITVGYLNGSVTAKALRAKLQSNYKLADMLKIFEDPKAEQLRDAVAEYKRTWQLEAVAAQYGIDTFQILYVVNSSARAAKALQAKKK